MENSCKQTQLARDSVELILHAHLVGRVKSEVDQLRLANPAVVEESP